VLSGASSGFLPGRFSLDGGSGDSSLRWRWHILRWTWTMVRQHPWWGVGPGAFPVALNQYQRLPYVSGDNPHNLYLELAAEYGLPAGLLAVLMLGGFLGRLASITMRAPEDDPVRRRLAALLAALVAFAVHSLVDLDWSFPAIALVAATLLGLASAHLQGKHSGHAPPARAWRACLILLLVAAAGVALSRYYATTLVTWGRFALSAGETASAERDLTWALRLNPLSFPAHQWLARVRLLSRDLQGAVTIAERAVRIAPSDPNSLYLAGEIAGAAGRWDVAEGRFRSTVDQAPFSQLRFHAGLVEAADRAGRTAEARWSYEQAVGIFTPERVLSEETSAALRRLLRLNVEQGTGRKAETVGYLVGGKTGTAEKPQGRGYSRNLQITSFVAIFPASEPKYLVFTMFDEPIGNRESFGFATAGWTAAPAAGRVVARIAPLLGVPRAIDPPSARMAAAAP